MSTVILRATTRVLTPVIVAFSVYLLLRGHDAPGGGFIAALVAGAAVVLQFMANGLAGVDRFLPLQAATLFGAGLLTAVGSGLVGLVLEGSFLAGRVWTVTVPVLGTLKVTLSLGFDVGVYLVVLAVIVTIVHYLGEPPEHEQEVPA